MIDMTWRNNDMEWRGSTWLCVNVYMTLFEMVIVWDMDYGFVYV